jgi:hypothetical protein
MPTYRKEIIKAAQHKQDMKVMADEIQTLLSEAFLGEKEKFKELVCGLEAEKLNAIYDLIIKAKDEKVSMKELLDQLIEFVIPIDPGFSFTFESPYSKASWYLINFGTFTPTQKALHNWQQRHRTKVKIISLCKNFFKRLIGR